MNLCTAVPEGDARDPAGARPELDFATATELQDHLLVASNDLERLHTLLANACDTLMQRFTDAVQHIDGLRSSTTDAEGRDTLRRLMADLSGAVTALQFQDLASQLIHHTNQRLRSCADTLARAVFDPAEDGGMVAEPAPTRPNPVTRSEMDAGSIELF